MYYMIKRIHSIKNLGIFQDYRGCGDLQDFSERNLIYGWNYSGKTTLSRLFSFMEKKVVPEEFAGAEFEIKLYGDRNPEPITHLNISTCPLDVIVFNSDYIADNLRYNAADKKIQGIKFDVGSNASARETIEANQKIIADSKASIEANKVNTQKFEEFEGRIFTDAAKHIKNECFKSAIEFNKGHLKTVMSQLEAANLDDYIISDDAELQSTQNIAIAQSNKEAIDIEDIESSFLSIYGEFKRILGYAPDQSVEDPVLSNDQSLYDWAKDGMLIHKQTELKKCAFCGQPLTEERMSFLNNFFTNQAALLKEAIQTLKTAIETEKKLIRTPTVMTISPNDVTEGLKEKWIDVQSKHKAMADDYDALLDELIAKLDEKYSSSLFVSVEVDGLDISANTAKDRWVESVAGIIKQHNETVDQFTTIREENRVKYKRHLVASVLKETKYFEIQRKATSETTKNAEILSLIRQKEIENATLLAQLKSITAGKARLNDFIKQFLNRDDIQIDTTEDDYFTLKRGGKIARNLSEGEKTAIAFAYFIVVLESIETDGQLGSYIIFIDDPISSLDANHIAQVSALINSFFFRQPTGEDTTTEKVICKVRQLFISTHNFEFHSFLRDANNFKRNRKTIEYINGQNVSGFGTLRHFMLKRNSSSSSSIVQMPKNLTAYKSEYVHLFAEIVAFHEAGCHENQNLLIPNAVRRFLEMYTLTRLPGNKGEVDSRIKEILGDITELKILHHFSHFTSFEGIAKHNELLLRLPEIIEDIFTLLSHDPQHYNSLLEAIGKAHFEPEAVPEQVVEPAIA